MQIIIVLGSSGFIGRRICKSFAAANKMVIGIDMVPCNENNLFKFYQSDLNEQLFLTVLKEHEVSVIINAAGNASVKDSFESPFADFSNNTILTYVVLDSIRKYSPKTKFVFLSSAAVYGNPVQLPVKESDPLNPISPYGFHKLQSELIAREFHVCFNISTIVLRIFSCYGAGQRKLFLWDLCNNSIKEKKILLKGCGNESRDFIHVDDVAACIKNLVDKSMTGFEVFNLASGNEYSIRDTAHLLAEKMGASNEIEFEGKKNAGNPDNWVADIKKLSDTGIKIQTRFEKGIEEYVRWFKSVS